jgi:hypothetical protein
MLAFFRDKVKPESQSTPRHFQIWGDVTQLSELDLRVGLTHWQENITKSKNEHVAAERLARYKGELQRRQTQSTEDNQTDALRKQISSLCDEMKALKTKLESLEKSVARVLAHEK